MDSHSPVVPIHSRITLMVLAFLFCSVATNVSAQQAKPNLSGTWKVNLSKSKPARQHGPGGERYKIKHSDPRLEIELTFDGRSETYTYITDGKERTANASLRDGTTQAKAYWDSDTLVIEKHQAIRFQDVGAFVSISHYTLSQDGKSLAVTHHVNKSSLSADFDESLTYEKQQ